VETGEKRKLTSPPAGDTVGDTAPAFSPDGRTLVFARYGTRTDLYLLRLAEGYRPQGEPERIASDNGWNVGAAWTPDGNEILFSSGTRVNLGLWRVAASQSTKPRRLAFVGDQAAMPAVSRQGNRLAYAVERYDSNIWRVDLGGSGQKPGIPVKFISSTKPEYYPAYSPDGKRIAFVSARSGAPEVWVCESDGSDPVQLTSFGTVNTLRPQWSPGGESIAFEAAPGGNEDIYVISASGGVPQRLTTDPRQDSYPCWSRDGKWLYFKRAFPGVPGTQFWKMPSSGGEAIQVTRNRAQVARESPDGKWLYYSRGWPGPVSLWRMPVGGGRGNPGSRLRAP